MSTPSLLPLETITHHILLLRGQKVLLDTDKQGLVLSRAGIRKADKLPRRKDFVFGIRYVNTISKEKIYFTPHPSFSAKVHRALEQTNNYYAIKQ